MFGTSKCNDRQAFELGRRETRIFLRCAYVATPENKRFSYASLRSAPKNSNSKMFTRRHPTEGNVGIGKIPHELDQYVDTISAQYASMIPDTNVFTYHTYYTDLPDRLKLPFANIQHHPFWGKACDNTPNCIMESIFEMNEVYFSNPRPNFEQSNLYGAAANLIPHKDCILFRFAGIRFYRVVIGITDGNTDTSTEFIRLGLSHKINRGDYVIFDFDRTFHRVRKNGQQETPRILLKLHFLVCPNCTYSRDEIAIIAGFYKYYYYIARYTEQIGTDPTTFAGFFFGLLWEWPFHDDFVDTVFAVFLATVMVVRTLFPGVSMTRLLVYSVLQMGILYLLIVLAFYGRYAMFRIR